MSSPKAAFPGQNSCPLLPFPARAMVSLALLAEAAFLAYNLAVRSPTETLIASTLLLACASMLKLIPLTVKPYGLERLRRILDELKRQTGLGQELKLTWIPSGSRTLSGEVRGNHIYVYDEKVEEAVETLIEEFFEYTMTEASKPYVVTLNAIIKHVNEEAYRKRDKAAKAIAKILLPLLLEKSKKE